MKSQLWPDADANAIVRQVVSVSLPTALMGDLEKAHQGRCQQPKAAGPSAQVRRPRALATALQ